jgi:hypothetical protein
VSVRGPSLSFDPQYVDFVIVAWQRQAFQPLSFEELQRLALERAEQVFSELTMIGLAERQATPAAVKAAIALLKALMLVKQMSSGPSGARIARVEITPLGVEILSEEPAVGGIRVGLVTLLTKTSPSLAKVISSLEHDGPLSRPIAYPAPGAPRKGAAFNKAVLQGLAQMEHDSSVPAAPPAQASTRQTASQTLKLAATQATRHHPASQTPSFDKIVALASDLGLLWRDVTPVNEALGIEIIGSATVRREDVYTPNIPQWEAIWPNFQVVLERTYTARVDNSGFVTIGAVRGGIGRELALSAPVVDAFLGRTRDAADRGECPFTLQFEPDDDLLYAANRKPLIWEGSAFDFVELQARQRALSSGDRAPIGARTGFMRSSH